nr:MAG TPA: hypothetical protein [Caudoviricetes sp.]
MRKTGIPCFKGYKFKYKNKEVSDGLFTRKGN